MRLISLQSGTSADGIDAAVVTATLRADAPPSPAWAEDGAAGPGGVTVVLEPASYTTIPWPDELRQRILAACTDAPTTVREITQLHALLGQEFGRAALQASGGEPVDLVVSHGQTVYHWVEGGRAAGTLQLGDASWIAETAGAPVLADVRSADIAAGGQGAPLMGLFDQLWLGHEAVALGRPMGTVNLGGIANVSLVLPDGRTHAWDTGPANALVDAVASRASGGRTGYDEDGALAAAGTVDTDLLQRLLAHPYFSAAAPKSTGRETFSLDWLDSVVAAAGGKPELPDLMATLTEFTAVSLVESILVESLLAGRTAPAEVIASGGGVRNPALMGALRRNLEARNIQLTASSSRGVDPDAKESLLFALLGFLSWHSVAAGLPGITGARAERIAGRFSPGPGPLQLPTPLTGVDRLVVGLPTSGRGSFRPRPAGWSPGR